MRIKDRMNYSIITCCYNSERVLKQTLNHLSNLTIPDSTKVNVWVVDNNSTDGTANIIHEHINIQNSAIGFHYLFESKQGKTNAILKAVEHCDGDYIIFCDDDNFFSSDYLTQANIFIHNYPEYEVIGGSVYATSSVPFPDWFPKYQGYYAIAPIDEEVVAIQNPSLAGAGLIIKGKVFRKVFDPRFPSLCIGPNGNIETRCDDGEICIRAGIIGVQFAKTKRLSLVHFIEPDRLTQNYLDKLIKDSGNDWYIIERYHCYLNVMSKSLLNRLSVLTKQLLKWVFGIEKTNGKAFSISKDYIYYITGWRYFEDYQNKIIKDFGDQYYQDNFRS